MLLVELILRFYIRDLAGLRRSLGAANRRRRRPRASIVHLRKSGSPSPSTIRARTAEMTMNEMPRRARLTATPSSWAFCEIQVSRAFAFAGGLRLPGR